MSTLTVEEKVVEMPSLNMTSETVSMPNLLINQAP